MLRNPILQTETTIEKVAFTHEEVPCTISVLNNSGYEEMNIETYVASVLLGEMPANFEMDALMAQAVAIRTYTLRRILTGDKHPLGVVCTNPGCCQAFEALEVDKRSQRILTATQNTAGEVLMYDDQLIDATYFSCSGGYTEAAIEVWGVDVPYLQSKVSPGEENARYYENTEVLSRKSFCEKLGISQSAEIIQIEYTDGGGVKNMTIDGKRFNGLQLRQLLGLRSTAMEIQMEGDCVSIITHGYGHRVGMSQYGAEAMAIAGSTYKDILSYYYPGTKLVKMTVSEMNAIFDKEEIL